MTKIKICGLTSPKEAVWLREQQVDYAGMVLFFPKSKRNITPQKAAEILEALGDSIIKVAVVVSPTVEQISQIERLHFDIVQIHGQVLPEVIEALQIPFWRAFNVENMQEYEQYASCEKCTGYIFDAQTPGSGKTFDWKLIPELPRGGKLFMLAGGLSPENVAEAVRHIAPDGVDVSSGVEFCSEDISRQGKDPERIRTFVQAVRNMDERAK